MTHDEAAAVVKRLTYRPGWTIEFYRDPSGASVLRVGVTEPDSEKPGTSVPVIYTDALEAGKLGVLTEAAFLRWVYEVFELRVVHELREWLRFDGTPLIEPHPEKGWKRGVLESFKSGASDGR